MSRTACNRCLYTQLPLICEAIQIHEQFLKRVNDSVALVTVQASELGQPTFAYIQSKIGECFNRSVCQELKIPDVRFYLVGKGVEYFEPGIYALASTNDTRQDPLALLLCKSTDYSILTLVTCGIGLLCFAGAIQYLFSEHKRLPD